MINPHQADRTFDPFTAPMTAIARDVLLHPRVTWEADRTRDALVLALNDELLVRKVSGDRHYDRLSQLLEPIATRAGALSDDAGASELLRDESDVEIWSLNDPTRDGNAIVASRRLRNAIYGDEAVAVPIVSPNHLAVVAGLDICPDGPPRLAGGIPRPDVTRYDPANAIDVVVIDTGYIPGHPGFAQREQNGGITAEPGKWFDSRQLPGPPKSFVGWTESQPDDFDTYPDPEGRPRLAGVAGHGTFITGIVAAHSVNAVITVVGHRHEVLPVEWANEVDRLRLFTSEVAVARSILVHGNADVISCGFAIPMLDGLESIAFDIVMPCVNPQTAVVAAAGNENTKCRYWPAAHADVFGVGATETSGTTKADFSNWGSWVNSCAVGEDVISTFGTLDAFPQDYTPKKGEAPLHFDGWALWNGTSFATPKVAAEIARRAGDKKGVDTPRDVANTLFSGASAKVTYDAVALPYVP